MSEQLSKPSAEPAEVNIERLAAGVTLRFHPDNIAEYTLTDFSLLTVDAWVARIKTEALSKPDGHVNFSMQDISRCKVVSLSAYTREKIKEMAVDLQKTHPNSRGYTAVILPRNFISHFVRFFMNTLPGTNRSVLLVFLNREDGLRWLQQMHEQYLNDLQKHADSK